MKHHAFTLAEVFSPHCEGHGKFAFTLAEVLITLGIIGVVAAITMPTLIKNYKKNVTLNGLKASYSLLSQAVNSSKQEFGDINDWDFELSDVEFAKKYVLPHLNVVKTVTNQKDTPFWRVKTLSTNDYPYLSWTTIDENNPIYILSNGSAIVVKRFLDLRTEIIVDINGPKGPNELGTDGFVFEISPKKNQLIPAHLHYDRDILAANESYGCNRNDYGQYYLGAYCAALIMKDGWQIKDGYPLK